MNMVLWRLGVLILWPFTRGVLRGRRIGPGRVPTSGATLVVCNHLSNLDPPLVGVMALPRKMHFMAKSELFSTRFGSWVLGGVGAFPVERGAGDREAIRFSREVLRDGKCLIMFPEGTRSRSGRLRPFFSGAGVLALEEGVTVIPAAIWGSQRKLGPIRVAFGDPIDMSDIPAGAKSVRAKEAIHRIQVAICELIPVVGGPPQTIPEGEPSLDKY